MKSLSFEIRTQVARESIRRVAESAKLLIMPRKTRKVIVFFCCCCSGIFKLILILNHNLHNIYKNDEQMSKILNSTCVTQWTGMNVELQINTQFLRATIYGSEFCNYMSQ